MPLDEFNEWRIYELIEPFADRRGDFQAALVCSVIANGQRTQKSDKIWTPGDFIPNWLAEPPKPQTVDEQIEMMMTIASAQNSIEENKRRLPN